MDAVDHAVVYFDPDVVAHKRLPALDAEFVRSCFDCPTLEVITDPRELEARLQVVPQHNHVLLMMSSGRFGGVEIIPSLRQVTSSR
jgi:UDP-N-acetylmuramate: L-alanyl-gamma-D-glutamyl-meso-diaminopimelate ligase